MTTYVRGDRIEFPDGTSQYSAPGIKSIQTGYIYGGFTYGSGIDVAYRDITISSVDQTKSYIYVQDGNMLMLDDSEIVFSCTARLVSSTVLRFYSSFYYSYYNSYSARWYVIEFK